MILSPLKYYAHIDSGVFKIYFGIFSFFLNNLLPFFGIGSIESLYIVLESFLEE